MAINTAERLIKSVDLSSVNHEPEIIPFKSIWDSEIPNNIIQQAIGYCLKYEASLLCGVDPRQNKAVEPWQAETRHELVNFIRRNPQGMTVYRSLRQANMVYPLGLRDIFTEKAG